MSTTTSTGSDILRIQKGCCRPPTCFARFHRGAFGLVLAEAMACGVPIIGRSGSLPEVVEEGNRDYLCHHATQKA